MIFLKYIKINGSVSNQRSIFNNLKNVLNFVDYESFCSKYCLSEYHELLESEFNGFEDNAKFYARTSGTTACSKNIPVTEYFLRRNHYTATKLALLHLCFEFNAWYILRGKNLALTGYKYLDEYKEKEVFDISALMFSQRPRLFREVGYPKTIYSNWSDKLKYFEQNLGHISNSLSLSGVPTWMISLFRYLENETEQKTERILHRLKLVIHGGVSFVNYFPIFDDVFKKRKLQFFEIFNSTEGFLAFQCSKDSNDLLLLTNCGIFYEFRNERGLFPIWDIKIGQSYEIVITTEDGILARYLTGDKFRITGLNPVKIVYDGRVGEFINAFGEDLEISQTNEAIKFLCKEFSLTIMDYFIVPNYGSTSCVGSHEWHLFVDQDLDKNKISKFLDTHLVSVNNNYKQKRHNSGGLGMPRVFTHDHELYGELLSKQGKMLGGQVKFKRLHNDRNIVESDIYTTVIS